MNPNRLELICRMVLRLIIVFCACQTVSCAVKAESLFKEGQFRAFTSDHKAYRVGDLLTVQVFENSSANSSVNTDNNRKNKLSASLDHGSANIVAQSGVGVEGSFDGGGRTLRSSRLLATITVSVKDVLTNGDLLIAGEQALLVNDERQKVYLEGRVRPVDISDANVVLSTKVADAKITYIGEGDLSEQTKRAWWRKILDFLGF